jgi:hypothetical protein
MTGLSKTVSRAVVSEISAVLGESRAALALGATSTRLKMLSMGKAKLTDAALQQIHVSTGKTWRTWLLDAAKRAGAPQRMLSSTSDLVNSLNDAESDAVKSIGAKTLKNSKKPRTARVA